MKISKEGKEIMKHTAMRAANGFFCGSSPDMDTLIEQGLMKFAMKAPFCPDSYYCLTEEGHKEVTRMTGGTK